MRPKIPLKSECLYDNYCVRAHIRYRILPTLFGGKAGDLIHTLAEYRLMPSLDPGLHNSKCPLQVL